MAQAAPLRFEGALRSWNDERGFGFIEADQGGEPVFVHIKAFPPGVGRPVPGLRLTFELELGPQGKKRAKGVRFPPAGRRPATARVEPSADWGLPRVLVLPCFLLLCAGGAWRWPVGFWVAPAYAVASVLTFVVYLIDKLAARKGGRRVPERTLHALALACGWPGALCAQQWLRHKTSKPSFVFGFWLTVTGNLLGFILLHTPVLRALRA